MNWVVVVVVVSRLTSGAAPVKGNHGLAYYIHCRRQRQNVIINDEGSSLNNSSVGNSDDTY